MTRAGTRGELRCAVSHYGAGDPSARARQLSGNARRQKDARQQVSTMDAGKSGSVPVILLYFRAGAQNGAQPE